MTFSRDAIEREIYDAKMELSYPFGYGLGFAKIKREGKPVFFDRYDELRRIINTNTEALFLMSGERA